MNNLDAGSKSTKREVLSLRNIFPSLITITSMLLGLFAIRQGVQNHPVEAIQLILISSILDALDGRIARMLKAVSNFGGELDSFSDFVTFGVAPAFIVYYCYLYNIYPLGWIVVCIFPIAAMIRLARFNVQNVHQNTDAKSAHSFFTGVPAPAGALLLLMPFYLSIGLNVVLPDYIICIYCLAMALLMVSTLPTLSLKKIRIRKANLPMLTVLVTILVLLLVYYTWMLLFIAGLLYLATIPLTCYLSWKHK